MENKKICPICDSMFIDNSYTGNRIYCSQKCADKANILRVKESNDKKNRWKRDKKCAVCGKEFYDGSLNLGRKFCSEKCAHESYIQKQKQYQENRKRNRELAKEMDRKPTGKKVAKSDNRSLEEIQSEARKLGMSYGQYVALMEGGAR